MADRIVHSYNGKEVVFERGRDAIDISLLSIEEKEGFIQFHKNKELIIFELGRDIYQIEDFKILDFNILAYLSKNPERRLKIFFNQGIPYRTNGELIVKLKDPNYFKLFREKTDGFSSLVESIENFHLIAYNSENEEVLKNILDNLIPKLGYEENWRAIHNNRSAPMPDQNEWREIKKFPPNPGLEAAKIAFPTGLPSKHEILIVLLDNGVYSQHHDFNSSLLENESKSAILNNPSPRPNRFDFHGTWCAGILAGNSLDEFGMKGAGAGCQLISIKVATGSPDLYQNLALSNFDLIKGFLMAFNLNCDIISCS